MSSIADFYALHIISRIGDHDPPLETMGVQFMQSNSLYSQLLQVGNLLHIGQHEACHNLKQGGAGGSVSAGGGSGSGSGGSSSGGGGYFKHLLIEGEESSISSQYVNAAEDTKPLIMRSLEIIGQANCGSLKHNSNFSDVGTPPLNVLGATNSEESPHQSTVTRATFPSPPLPVASLKNPPCASTLKRARDQSTHIEGHDAICKKEKKASEEKEKGKKGGQQQAQGAASGGRKSAVSAKTKAPKPVLIEAPKTDYVHVRARRGQATDSHSLAERVRREKISERMRFLQDLVPGCSKVTGKALVLDEIINYVQSLQNQVEFLAMRLAATHPKLDHLGLNHFIDEEIASPFAEEVKQHIDMIPKILGSQTPTSDSHFESLPQFYSSLFDEANFNTSIVSDLSTSTCNDSNLTNMDFSHLS